MIKHINHILPNQETASSDIVWREWAPWWKIFPPRPMVKEEHRQPRETGSLCRLGQRRRCSRSFQSGIQRMVRKLHVCSLPIWRYQRGSHVYVWQGKSLGLPDIGVCLLQWHAFLSNKSRSEEGSILCRWKVVSGECYWGGLIDMCVFCSLSTTFLDLPWARNNLSKKQFIHPLGYPTLWIMELAIPFLAQLQ